MRRDGLQTKNRIMTVCARLFLENGYHRTTLQQICKEAQVSTGSFFNLFGSKDGVLLELIRFVYQKQFSFARGAVNQALPPVYVYAVETSIQIAITELSDNLRDIYLEAYTQRKLLEFIQSKTAGELYGIFGQYQPQLAEEDFLAIEFCTAGIMRGCMANPCTAAFPLEKKLHTFLSLTLRALHVPEELIGQVLDFIAGLEIREMTRQVMEELLNQLAVRYDLPISGIWGKA